MRRIINKVLALMSTVVIAAGTIALPAAASGVHWDFTSQLVTLNRGESKTIQMVGGYYPAIYITGNSSKDTRVGCVETSAGHYDITFYCGADETATGWTAYFYTSPASGGYDWVNVHVADNLGQTSAGSTGSAARTFATDYAGFNQQVASSVRNAAQGGTVTINAGKWTSLYRTAIAAIEERPDVTLVINYTYKGAAVQVTVPANAHIETLMDANGCIGFAALGAYTTK